jgi:diguanylate cyclase (GGDEF)-like protein
MRDGAATVSDDGLVLYANQRLADLLCVSLSRIVGFPFISFIPELSRPRYGAEMAEAGEGHTLEMDFRRGDGTTMPTLLGLFRLDVETDHLTCITITDLSAQKAQEGEISRLAKAQREHMIDLQAAVRALTEQANHDALTGLPNRDLLVDRLEQALIRARRMGTCTGVMFVDLDHFKRINDTLGHTAGDTVLWHVAATLRRTVRSMDTVARLGGDEFVVLCPDLRGPVDAVHISRRIVADLSRLSDSWAPAAGLTASVGVTLVDDGASTAEDMLHEADTAMYRAKSLGRNRTQIFQTAPHRRAHDRSIPIA